MARSASIVLISLGYLLGIQFLAITVQAQYVSIGSCPKVVGIPNFNTSAYQGLWYEVEKFWFVFEATTSCVRVTYHNTTHADGSFPVEILQYDHVTGKTFNNPGLTRFASTSKTQKDGTREGDFILDVVITQSPIPFTVKYPYLVLGTDYTTYTIKWSCTQLGPLQAQNIWILSREKQYRPKTRRQVHALLKKLGIATHPLRKSNLSRCPEGEGEENGNGQAGAAENEVRT